jgi:3',5'-cyclic AMP phosphodiesterase CpdA
VTRIAQLSDLHFGLENRRAAEMALATLRAASPEIILIAGDLTVQARPGEFAAAQVFLAGLGAPVLSTPGNHDAPYTAARLTTPFARYESAIGPVGGQVFLSPTLAVAAVNTARGAQLRLNWSKGAIGKTQARAALTALAGAPPTALRVVLCHHPLVEMIAGPMTGRVRGGEAAARAFAEAGVDLVLTGHVHVPFALPLPFGDGRSYAVGSGTLSVRERGAPAGFNLIDVEPDAVRVEAVGWTGSHFQPWRTWSLERRQTGAVAKPPAADRGL